jgi:4-amino-4-deoxychorismate lyase
VFCHNKMAHGLDADSLLVTGAGVTLVDGVPAEAINVGDRGLQYGDGVFRTLRLEAGLPVWWADHYRKLRADCLVLDIEPPLKQDLLEDVQKLALPDRSGIVKIMVTRGVGGRGYAVRLGTPSCRIVTLHAAATYPADEPESGVTVRPCTLRLGHQPRLAGVKHLNRLENVLARLEWSDPTIAEGLLLDEAERVVEGVTSNLFIQRGGRLITPDLSRCGVAGVARERLMCAAVRHGVEVEVRDVAVEELGKADALYLTNSLIGVWRIARVQGLTWQPRADTYPLQSWLDEETEA